MIRLFIMLVCGFVVLSKPVKADQERACSGLEDIIRSAVDGIPPQTQYRFLVALEAHKRLKCNPQSLIEILRLN